MAIIKSPGEIVAPYTERLRELKYISPSGQRFYLAFDEVSEESGKKAPVSEFPDQNQGVVQDLGEQTLVYQITCYIHGNDYDLESDRFRKALTEKGPGILQHPRYGTFKALPTSRKVIERFVDGAGEAVFDITFIKVEDVPITRYTTASMGQLVIANVDLAQVATLATLADTVITDARKLAALVNNVRNGIALAGHFLRGISGMAAAVQSQINKTINGIISEVETLAATPQDLMESMISLYRLPGRTITSVKEKVEAYINIFTTIAADFVTVTEEYGELIGQIFTAQSNGVAIATAEAVTAGTIKTTAEAAAIIASLSALKSDIDDTTQDMEDAGDFSADYEMQAAVKLAVSNALRYVIDQALSLPVEQRFTLERDVPPNVLLWELDGDVSRLEEFIDYNDLQSDEIFTIPRGREVKWYAEV